MVRLYIGICPVFVKKKGRGIVQNHLQRYFSGQEYVSRVYVKEACNALQIAPLSFDRKKFASTIIHFSSKSHLSLIQVRLFT